MLSTGLINKTKGHGIIDFLFKKFTKHNKFIINLNNTGIHVFLICIVLFLMNTGCRSDEPFQNVMADADGRTTLNILVPSPSLGSPSRGELGENHSERLATEGTIHNLAIIGFYTEANERKHFYSDLTEATSETVDDVYLSYKLKVVPAEYSIYIIGNYDIPASTLAKLTSSTTTTELENEIKELELNLRTEQNGSENYILPTVSENHGLPMTFSGTTNVTEGQTKRIVADLKFACSKVRVTVLYDKGFGQDARFHIDGDPTLKNILTKTQIFEGSVGSAPEDIGLTGSKYYGLSSLLNEEGELMSIEELSGIPEVGKDPLDALGDELNQNADGYLQFAWQNTVYIPENLTEDTPTIFQINLPDNPSEKNTFEINLGCSFQGTSENVSSNDKPKLMRSHFYDIIAIIKSDGIKYAWDIADWKVEPIALQLAGKTSLYLSKTRIPEVLTGGDTYQIPYTTNAPRLTFESDKQGDRPIFNIKENKEEGTIDVSLRGNITADSETLHNKGFWVNAGNIRKRVEFDNVSLAKFLRLRPKTQSVSIKQIINELSFPMFFEYATNYDNLTLNLESLINSNKQKEFEKTNGKISSGIYVEIVEETISESGNVDYKPISIAVPLSKEKAVFSGYTNMKTGYELPKNGLIRLTIVDPTNTNYFSKQISGAFKASVENGPVQTAEFTIVPNAPVYTIHFKAIEGTNEDAWGERIPHIYIYQPLYLNGYPVYGKSGDKTINWIEYSFTGNYAFKGWKSEGGEIDNLSISRSTFNDAAGQSIYGYDIKDAWGDPGTGDSAVKSGKFNKVNLLGDFMGSCTTCFPQNGDPNLPQVWPGVGMRYEGNGWYRVEIPLLAKADMAYAMFNHGHDGANNHARYPADKIPGVVIPNFADSEAWYILDKNKGTTWENCGYHCVFVDDCPDSGPIYPNDEEIPHFKPGQYRLKFNGNYYIWAWVEHGDGITEVLLDQVWIGRPDTNASVCNGYFDFPIQTEVSVYDKLYIIYMLPDKSKQVTISYWAADFYWNESIKRWELDAGNIQGL